jgi:hypothetical protein
MRADIISARSGIASQPVTVRTASFQNGAMQVAVNERACSTKSIHRKWQLTLSRQAGVTLAASAVGSILERGNGLTVS